MAEGLAKAAASLKKCLDVGHNVVDVAASSHSLGNPATPHVPLQHRGQPKGFPCGTLSKGGTGDGRLTFPLAAISEVPLNFQFIWLCRFTISLKRSTPNL
jgi:hypothetical protein